MFNKKLKSEEVIEKEEPIKSGEKKIVPLKDFVIFQNDIKIELKESEEISVPAKFLDNLKAEKVI